MNLDYFVLNVKAPSPARWRGGLEGAVKTDDILGGVLGDRGEPEAAAAAAPSLDAVKLETASLSEPQAREAARDPSNTVALVMPVVLIEPCKPEEYGLLGDGDPIAAATASKISWGIPAVGADTSSLTGAGVTVAVLDTGIDATHPAFAGVNLVPRNFAGGEQADVTDRHGHGTHCAGTIFGRDVDGVRIGIARGVTNALIGKVLDDRGRGSTAAVLNALHWAGTNGANIVSMSLGFDFPGMQQQLVDAGRPTKLATFIALKAYRENLRLFETLIAFLALENPASPGLLAIAANGNESMRQLDPDFVIDTSLPAAASASIVSVGALGRQGGLFTIAPFSNVNPVLSAPGVDIISARAGGGLAAMSGTSMACPHVAGLAALWWEWARRTGRVTGSAVQARVRASCSLSGFAPGVTTADRGEGLATAPAIAVA